MYATEIDLFKKKREKDVDYWQAVRILQNRRMRHIRAQSAYITERQNECVTMHRARTLQKDRTKALQCTGNGTYYRTEKWQNQRVVTINDVDYRNDN